MRLATGGLGVVVMCASCILPGDTDSLSTTTQSLADFSQRLDAMDPTFYWRLGDMGTTIKDDGPTGTDGTYHGVYSLGEDGGVVDDPDSSVRFLGGATDGYGEISDRKAMSLTRAWDSFNRVYPASVGLANSWGAAPDGQLWTAQVSPGNYYRTNGANAAIYPPSHGATFQQGLPTQLLGGDIQVRVSWDEAAQNGPLQPVALVAQYKDNNNYVKAELIENDDHTLDLQIVKVLEGTSTTVAYRSSIGTYAVGEWWYVRFQFNAGSYRARAWRMGDSQYVIRLADSSLTTDDCDPTRGRWDVCGAAPSAIAGTVALRSANSASSSRPVVSFASFWTQTLGLTIHMMVQLHGQQNEANGGYKYNLFGKGDRTGADGNREYTFRYHDDDCPASQPTDCHAGEYHFKTYINDLEGLKGAGVDYAISPEMITRTSPAKPIANNWHELVVMFDSGDALDPLAGVTLYANGSMVPGSAPGTLNGEVAALYNGAKDCAGGTPELPGECIDAKCDIDSGPGVNIQNCWTIFPLSGDGPLRFGARDTTDGVNAWFDELAIFSRKLDATEIETLHTAVVTPENRAPVAVASASGTVAFPGQTIRLSGASSYDLDGDGITYAWSFSAPVGSAASLDNPTFASPTFVVDVVGDYYATLVVTDARGAISTPASVHISTITATDYAVFQIDQARTIVGQQESAMSAPGQLQAIHNLLDEARRSIVSSRNDHALDKLVSVRARTDGWSLRGAADTSGPGRDWVVERSVATQLYDTVELAITALQSL